MKNKKTGKHLVNTSEMNKHSDSVNVLRDFFTSMDLFLFSFSHNREVFKSLPQDLKEHFLRLVKYYARLLLVLDPDRAVNHLYRAFLVFDSTIQNSTNLEMLLKEEEYVKMLEDMEKRQKSLG